MSECIDCIDLLSDINKNYFKLRERKCFVCMVFINSDKPCDICGETAVWFYLDPKPGEIGRCNKCAPDGKIKGE
ncbi:MAG: hypothetical protein ACW98D_18890 [Promethearchaeota archaeon]|jgi:hypothetical protein